MDDEQPASDFSPTEEQPSEQALIPADILKYIPEEHRGEFIRQTILHVEQYSGPLPHPEIAKGWEDIVPGSAERMLGMAEQRMQISMEMARQSQNHTVETERAMIRSITVRESYGQWFAFIAVLIALIGGFLIIDRGHGHLGLIALATPIAAITGGFIVNSLARRTNPSRPGDIADQMSTASDHSEADR